MSKATRPSTGNAPAVQDPKPVTAPTFEANGKTLVLSRVGNDYGCKARDLGRVLGYAANGKGLVDKVTGAWAKDFVAGVDFLRGGGGESQPPLQGHEIILTRSGINLVCILTRKPLGRQIRQWLARDVMVQIADTGTFAAQAALTTPVIDPLTRSLVASVAALEARLDALTRATPPVQPAPAPRLPAPPNRLPEGVTRIAPNVELLNFTHVPWNAGERLRCPWLRVMHVRYQAAAEAAFKARFGNAFHLVGEREGAVQWRTCFDWNRRQSEQHHAGLYAAIASGG